VNNGCAKIHIFMVMSGMISFLSTTFFLMFMVMIMVLFDQVLFFVVVGMLVVLMFLRLNVSLNSVSLVILKEYGNILFTYNDILVRF
jgi:hypothetical protein